MLSIANEVDPLIFHCVSFVYDANMCFSNMGRPSNMRQKLEQEKAETADVSRVAGGPTRCARSLRVTFPV